MFEMRAISAANGGSFLEDFIPTERMASVEESIETIGRCRSIIGGQFWRDVSSFLDSGGSVAAEHVQMWEGFGKEMGNFHAISGTWQRQGFLS